MSMIYPTKGEISKIYSDVEKLEKQRQVLKKIGEQLKEV